MEPEGWPNMNNLREFKVMFCVSESAPGWFWFMDLVQIGVLKCNKISC